MADYTVNTLSGLNAALAAISTAGGKTIDIEAGTIASGTIGTDKTFASPVIITGAGVGQTILKGWSILNKMKGVEFRDIEFWRDDSITNSVVELEGPVDIVMDGCDVHGIYRDPYGDYSAAGAYTNCVGIRGANNGGFPLGFTFKNGKIYDCLEGLITVIEGASGVIMQNAEVYHTYSDTVKITPQGAGLTAPKWFIDVAFHSFVGDPEFVDNPHIDLIQFFSNVNNDGQDVTNIVCRRVVAWEGSGGVGRLIQGIVSFMDGGYMMKTKNPIIEGCYLLLAEQHAISLTNCNGGLIRNNTVALPSPTYETGYTNGKAQILIDGTGTITVTDNIWDVAAFTGAATYVQSGNVNMGLRGANHSFADTFVGPTFAPTTQGQVLTKFASKIGGPAEGKGASAFEGAGPPPNASPMIPLFGGKALIVAGKLIALV